VKAEFNYAPLLRLNAPEFYQDPAFVAWLDDPAETQATWHRKGFPPNEYSDMFFTWDSGEGSNSDMPEHIWDKICDIVTEQYGPSGFCIVWLSNLEE